jgi:hypothetical protein
MILHFIRRDFRSDRSLWTLFVVVFGAAVPVAASDPSFYVFFFLGPFIFALLPIQRLTGVTWRSQHIMSRNYMLSLPVSRHRMYLATVIRAGVYAAPFVLTALIFPVWALPEHELFSWSRYGLYVPVIAAAVFWQINALISTQIDHERISSHLTARARFVRLVGTVTVSFTEFVLCALCLFGCWAPYPYFLACPLLAAVGALLRWRSARAKWIGLN